MDTTLDQPTPITQETPEKSGETLRTISFSRFENCDAVVISLSPTRHVIVRRDDAKRIVPAERICKRIRDLTAGDQVIYNGRRETVHGVSVF